MGVINEIRKETPFLRIGVAIMITLLALGLPMLASGSLGSAGGLFVGGFVVVYFVGGWLYDQIRGRSRSNESQTAG